MTEEAEANANQKSGGGKIDGRPRPRLCLPLCNEGHLTTCFRTYQTADQRGDPGPRRNSHVPGKAAQIAGRMVLGADR